MKKLIFTHIFLNLYLLALVQPAVPILEYLIHYDYIVNELCENRNKPILSCEGMCYLGDQVEKQLDTHDSQEKPVPPKYEMDRYVNISVYLKDESNSFEFIDKETPEAHKALKEELFADLFFQPPIV